MIKPEHDGKAYRYPGGDSVASGLDALRWALTRKPAKWPARVDNPPPDSIAERVHGDAMRVTFINHATVLIQSEGLNLITDPVFSRRVSPVSFAGPARHRPPGIVFDELPPIDAVLISHCHYDHLDIRSLRQLHERDSPVVIAPLANGPIVAKANVSNTIELNWWEAHALSHNVKATLVPSRHWSSRSLGDANRALWGGYVLELPGGAIYFAGDTGYGNGSHFVEAKQALGPFRLALLPIGAYEPRWFMRPQHMNPAEAVQAFKDLEAEQALAIHFGTFQLTDEAIDAPERDLAEALVSDPALSKRFHVLENGQALNL